jgi:uncharacterized protein
MHPANSIHEAYKRGDLEALKELLGNPPNFPNCRGPQGMGEIILEYAIYWSPLEFIQKLLEIGADPNYGGHAGFPSLIATLSTDRADKIEILKLLLSSGADVQQRGVNGYTPLHYAAALNDPKAVELLLVHGADPNARTNVDDFSTPLEEAVQGGHADAVAALRIFSKT